MYEAAGTMNDNMQQPTVHDVYQLHVHLVPHWSVQHLVNAHVVPKVVHHPCLTLTCCALTTA